MIEPRAVKAVSRRARNGIFICIALCADARPSIAGICSKSGAEQFSWSVSYQADLLRNTDGGAATGSAYLDDAYGGIRWNQSDWSATCPRISAGMRYNNGHSFSGDVVGDLQGVSSIEAVHGARLYDLWLEVPFLDRRGSVRAGLQDLNTEFNWIHSAGTFVHSSFGIGPEFGLSGVNGPAIFPMTALMARLQWYFTPKWRVRAVVADGVPGRHGDPSRYGFHLSSDEGALVTLELASRLEADRGKFAIGAWAYTAEADRFDAAMMGTAQSTGNDGFYLDLESNAFPGPARSTGRVFLRAGLADERFNSVDANIGAGVVLEYPVADSGVQKLGFGATYARLGRPYRTATEEAGVMTTSHETALELTYERPVAPWLTLQPDLQYVFNPGGVEPRKNAFVIALRFKAGLAGE